jgi:Stage II sporulation protein E (SpoIIE)/GAF domain
VTGAEVSDDREVTAPYGGTPGYLLPPRLKPPDPSSDPAVLARQVLEAVVAGFADAAGVFVLEQLLSGGSPARPAADTELVVRRLATRVTEAGRAAPHAGFPDGEVTAFAADSPYARCVYDRAPVIFAHPDRGTLRRISPPARTVMERYTSFIAAPMAARGAALGLLVLARTPRAPAFCDTDAEAAADLADRVATAVAGSLALMRHRSVAEALQPLRTAPGLAMPRRLEVAGRCLPADGYETGGDWYDVIPLPGDRTALIVGDVMGHGPQAATGMARLSAAAYALADIDLPPSEVLRQLNRTALALPQATLATCAYAVIDPAQRSCDFGTAGHLPPVLAMPGGTTRVPDLPGGQSLGVAPARYGEARIKLPPCTILALYTDGLVETRTRSFDQGILTLRSVLARQHRDLDAACDELIASLGKSYEDDITVVLARIQPSATA